MVSGRLTTHVLDQAAGKPASGLKIELFRLLDGEPQLVSHAVTNADGRTDGPMADGESFTPGTYELLFHAGDYLKAAGHVSDGILFLDTIPLRFGIADANQHFHVPLLLSPYGYATYRGS
ncbi:hydroxyisourate hydrolase [Nisaea sp.]|uniref:hydroxyisourate hydrolase n=1 Tax=Nisaea sp. TaxID=2024842 RepID=UPI003299B1B1